MESQTVHCPNCAALVPAQDINIAALTAKCGRCDHIFPLAAVGAPGPPSETQPPPVCPRGVVCETGPGGELYLRRNWFQPAILALIPFCLFWNGFLVTWYVILLKKPPHGNMFWFALLFPLMHVAVGVGLTYFLAASLMNVTRILVDGDFVHVRHQPVPWPGSRDLARSDIREIVSDFGWRANNKRLYKIIANRADGESVKLVSSLSDRQARYMGYELGKYLGVPFTDGTAQFRLVPRLPAWAQKWFSYERR